MIENELREAEEILNLFYKCETKMSLLYRKCGQVFPAEKEFWEWLSKEEELHAYYIQEMIELLRDSPGEYKRGRPFNRKALITVIRGVEYNIEHLSSGKKGMLQMLSIALDIENSLIESKFREFILSENDDYKKLSEKIAGDTSFHKRKIAYKKDEFKEQGDV